MSLISSATTNVTGEASDSNDSNYTFHAKRQRHDNNVSSSTFKGVIAQLNGHWGAQIYANHQRIWLGTFKSEKEAAMAYDSAAIKLRSGDSHRNLPWTSITAEEPNFQSQFSTQAVLHMIKDGSYPSKFADYLGVQVEMGKIEASPNLSPMHDNGGFLCKHLFRKQLTPSDVSTLNRLVIPKKNAVMYFPRISVGTEEKEAGGGVDDMQLVFFDRSMRSWKFRYCYWKGSQSFVFTRGWSRFVKEKNLKAKDMVIFYASECKDGGNEVRKLFMIDVSYYARLESNGELVEESEENVDPGENIDDAIEDEKESEEEKEILGGESVDEQRKGLRLFGVQII